jgi:alpha-tubulin suppressor-like RCC1 family protein
MKILQAVLTLIAVFTWPLAIAVASPAGQVIEWGYPLPQTAGYLASSATTGLVSVASQVLTDAVAVAAGDYHGLALRNDGTVFGWGWNHLGQAIGVQTPDDNSTNGLVTVAGHILRGVASIAAGSSFSLALRDDGTVITWGKNHVPSGLSNVVAISARGFFSLALKSDGTVVAWSSLPERSGTPMPAGLSNVVAISAGGGLYQRSLALQRDGIVVLWGPNASTQPVPAGLTNVSGIAAGGGHCLALRRDGTVEAWGDNNASQATGPPETKAPYYSDGTVEINGRTLTGVVGIAAGSESSLALRADGTVAAWGYVAHRPATVPAGLSNVVAIAAGENFCLAITTNAGPFAAKK